jgi:tRNA (uracil-5-)-methyltransferase TRM9
MLPETVDRLLDLNRRFYQSFAEPFAETRQREQPGVRRLAERIPASASVLDLGCGAGGLARALAHNGHSGNYLGVDAEAGLLAAAQAGPAPEHAIWRQMDVARAGWWEAIGRSFDVVCAFALLHHLPSEALRLTWARGVRALVEPSGWCALSVWDFLALPDVDERIIPWEAVNLSQEDIETGDFLVDWRRGGRGIRYVHHFADEDLERLAQGAGFRILESFRSDGRGGQLGLYHVWGRDDSKGSIL